jgi:hypothetical protein
LNEVPDSRGFFEFKFRRQPFNHSGSLAMLAAMRRASSRASNANYRSGFGFHSRASFCASAICAGVIFSPARAQRHSGFDLILPNQPH